MSEVRYEAHPKIFRMRPIAALIVFLIMLAGFLLVGLGERFAAAVLAPRGFPLSGQDLQYLGVILFALGCLRLYAWYAPTRFERLTITDETLVWVRGFMSKQRIEVSRDAVRTLQVTQGLLQRGFDVGDVAVFTTGDRPEFVVRGLPDPARIRALVQGPTTATAA